MFNGQYASIISTIVDVDIVPGARTKGQYASIISTIVDRVAHSEKWIEASMLQ